MAYRITYGRTGRSTVWTAAGAFRLQLIGAGALFLFALAAKEIFPGAKQILAQMFLPVEGTAVQVMARELCKSGNMWDSLVVFCRQVLENAGYEG